MIYDSLERLALYRGLHPNLDKAIAYCLERDFSQQEAGKYQLDGDQVSTTPISSSAFFMRR